MDESCLDFVLEAVKLVANYGWSLLPQVCHFDFITSNVSDGNEYRLRRT